RARPQVEPLETRAVPAGDVAAFLFGGDLIVVGDSADNAVEILVTDGNLVVQGREGTDITINGGSRILFEGVDRIADDLRVFLGGGNDLIDIRGVSVDGNVSIQADGFFVGGRGDDQVLLDLLTIDGNLDVSTGGGDDAVLLERSAVAGDTTISTGSGADRFALVAAGLGGRLTVETGAGDDRAFVTQMGVSGRIRVDTGSGNDDIIFHGATAFGSPVSLDGGSGRDSAEIDAASTFASGQQVRSFESVDVLAVTEFSTAEGLLIRRLFAGDAPGTGSTEFTLNGASFSGGEVVSRGFGPAYASAPAAFVPGPEGATITFDTPAEQVRFFFTHLPGDAPGAATAFDEEGDVIATVQSNQATFLGDPGNFVTLSGEQRIARVVINGGMIDNVTFVR
ncbi:MAG: hypothetical protein L0Z62_50805, partial [Gemmataceae bacterium]|nr:hypothetical protein [Gemmataceae bacterium]